jgi:hypothetical protein
MAAYWLLYLPDLNPVDNDIWPHKAGKSIATAHRNVDSLNQTIHQE